MSSPGLWATVAVVVLALVGVATGLVGAIELSQPTSSTTTTYSSYSASVVPVLNASLRPNWLYQAGNVTDPPDIFANITTSLAFSVQYQFAASQSMPVTGEISTETTFYSGTSPTWSMVVEYQSRPLLFNASFATEWVEVPLNLSSILNSSAVVDQQLNVTPGAGTLVLNTSAVTMFPGAVAQNNSSLELTFDYSSASGAAIVPSAYSAIEVAKPQAGTNSGIVTAQDTTALPSEVGIGETYLAIAAAAFIAALVVGWAYVPRQRPTKLRRFLSENAENVVRVRADTRPAGKAVSVADVGELVKLANLSGQPIFLFESPAGRGSFLYVIQGDTTFGLTIGPEESS